MGEMLQRKSREPHSAAEGSLPVEWPRHVPNALYEFAGNGADHSVF